MNILHIIRRKGEMFPAEIIAEHRKSGTVDVLLIQDAVFLYDGFKRNAVPGQTAYACKDDLVARGMAVDKGALTYPEIVSLIWKSDRVVCW